MLVYRSHSLDKLYTQILSVYPSAVNIVRALGIIIASDGDLPEVIEDILGMEKLVLHSLSCLMEDEIWKPGYFAELFTHYAIDSVSNSDDLQPINYSQSWQDVFYHPGSTCCNLGLFYLRSSIPFQSFSKNSERSDYERHGGPQVMSGISVYIHCTVARRVVLDETFDPKREFLQWLLRWSAPRLPSCHMSDVKPTRALYSSLHSLPHRTTGFPRGKSNLSVVVRFSRKRKMMQNLKTIFLYKEIYK